MSFIVKEEFLQKDDLSNHIYQCHFDRKAYTNLVPKKLDILLPESLLKAVVSRKSDFIAGRYAAQKCLSALNIESFSIDIGDHREPLWPENIIGSITHTQNVALAVATEKDKWYAIGIDAEKIIEEKVIENTKNLIMYYSEQELVEAYRESAQTLFSILFSIKEAFFKAAYPSVGFYFDFDAIEVTHIDLQENSFQFRIMQNLNQQFIKGQSYKGKFWIDNDIVISLIQI